jgi:hypothetical protein
MASAMASLESNHKTMSLQTHHQVQVKIVRAEVLERRIECLLDVVGVVGVVPKLRRNEELLARHARLLNGIANSRFCAVDARCVDVFVASLQCNCDSSAMTLA